MNHLFTMSQLYEYTLAIIGTESLIMGITLLAIAMTLKKGKARSKTGLVYLAISMLALCLINLVEDMVGVDGEMEDYSLSVIIFASSVEMFFLLCAYMSMLYRGFATKSRICVELGLILIFTVPAMLISPIAYPVLFRILFVGGIGFYIVKLLYNWYIYRRRVKKVAAEIENYLSDDGEILFQWINRTFYMVLTIGIVSVIVPLTNFAVLFFYNIFVFLAYFYIYLSVIRNIHLFEENMSIVENDTTDIQTESYTKKVESILFGREKFLREWIANKGYAVAGVTANEVATKLNINRTKLSLYLKNELNTSYYEWIAKLRIEDAKNQLITYPNRSIYEIALNVGIEDRDNFRRVFQRFVGMSPTTYRKEHFEKTTQ